MKEINLITSSDGGYVKHLFTQLKNISDNLVPLYEVHLWFFYFRVDGEDIEELTDYAKFLGINFHAVYIYDYEDYEILRKGAQQTYPLEGYIYICAHKYLPENINRALYIDAADIIFDGDIGEFYFAPFDGNFLISSLGFSKQQELYNFDDLKNVEKEPVIISEYINAGSLMLNLELMRIFNIDISFYENVVQHIMKQDITFTTSFYPTPVHYAGDQGLIAAAFVGRTKLWGYERHGYDEGFMPYNFRPYTLEFTKKVLNIPDGQEPIIPYEPRIIHLLGNKPWSIDKETYSTLLPVSKKYLDMFWESEREAKAWRENNKGVKIS
jgi:lipopolysaccharide biosynthesis glycosyltransferase